LKHSILKKLQLQQQEINPPTSPIFISSPVMSSTIQSPTSMSASSTFQNNSSNATSTVPTNCKQCFQIQFTALASTACATSTPILKRHSLTLLQSPNSQRTAKGKKTSK
jgi:hypothetical protein